MLPQIVGSPLAFSWTQASVGREDGGGVGVGVGVGVRDGAPTCPLLAPVAPQPASASTSARMMVVSWRQQAGVPYPSLSSGEAWRAPSVHCGTDIRGTS